jgi:RNA polymerase sigma-70 factor (ECF subfamily)
VTTAHVVWKHLRRRKLERRLFEELLPEVPMMGGSPAREAQWRQTAEFLKEQLDGMNAERASAFVLHDVWGYDLREMAEILGISVAAAQTRLSRGRRELEARIAKDPQLASALLDELGSHRTDGGADK